MPPIVASAIFAIGILGLFYLDRGHEARTSKALWIPTIWLLITSSRPFSFWLGMAPTAGSNVYLEGSPIDRTIFICLGAAALAVIIGRSQRVGPHLHKNFPLLLYIMYCGGSIFWSDFPVVAFKRWIKLVEVTVVVLIIMTEPEPMAAVKRLVTRVGFLLIPLSVLFIKYYPTLGRRPTNGTGLDYTGVTTQKNTLGVICMVYGVGLLWMLLCVYRDRENPSRRRRLMAYGAVLLMIVWLLSKCNSMTSIAGLTMAGIVMVFSTRPSLVRKRAVVHLLVLAVIGISLFAIFFQQGGGLLKDIGRNSTLTGRTQVWSIVLSIPNNRWVGTGYASFWLGHRLQEIWQAMPNLHIDEAHNGYIEVYLNLGWVGVSLIALLLGTAYRKIITLFRQDPEKGALLLGFLLIVIFESLTEAAFRMMSPTWFFFNLVLLAAFPHIVAESRSEIGSLRNFGDPVFIPQVGEGSLTAEQPFNSIWSAEARRARRSSD